MLLPLIGTFLTDASRMAIGVSSCLPGRLLSVGARGLKHTCVYRMMRQNNLLLQPSAHGQGSHSSGSNVGALTVLRWPVSTERRYAPFLLDTCDREVMAFPATIGGYSANMTQSVMLACGEKRFGDVATLQPGGGLSANGSCHRAKETIAFCHHTKHHQQFTPALTPEAPTWLKLTSKHSNGSTPSARTDQRPKPWCRSFLEGSKTIMEMGHIRLCGYSRLVGSPIHCKTWRYRFSCVNSTLGNILNNLE